MLVAFSPPVSGSIVVPFSRDDDDRRPSNGRARRFLGPSASRQTFGRLAVLIPGKAPRELDVFNIGKIFGGASGSRIRPRLRAMATGAICVALLGCFDD